MTVQIAPERKTTLPRRTPPPPQPDPEPEDLASCLEGPNGLDLVVEMAHDLRSPLTSILFLTEALHQGQTGPVTEAQQRALGLVYSAALCLSPPRATSSSWLAIHQLIPAPSQLEDVARGGAEA